MTEFLASALHAVGSLKGPCLITLTGAAITVKKLDGTEVATWPYNCIRQFGAEEELRQFTFISGRRGPFGVSEYAFELSEQTLKRLQDALTQFTGAKFGTGFSGNRRPPPNYSSVADTVAIQHGTTKRSESAFSGDSVFVSPPQQQRSSSDKPPPKLPPRHAVSMSSVKWSPHKQPMQLSSSMSEARLSPSLPPSSVKGLHANQSYEATGKQQLQSLAQLQQHRTASISQAPKSSKTNSSSLELGSRSNSCGLLSDPISSSTANYPHRSVSTTHPVPLMRSSHNESRYAGTVLNQKAHLVHIYIGSKKCHSAIAV